MPSSPLAGTFPSPDCLVDIPRLVSAYFSVKPDPFDPAQRIAFGTSGHRGSALSGSFNEDHILAVTQAICTYRKTTGSTVPFIWDSIPMPCPGRPLSPHWRC